MDVTFIERMRQRLTETANECRALITSLESGFASTLTESVGELSSLDNHTSDLSNETMERQKDLGLIAQLETTLALCEEALQRLEQGQYGICASCGRPIGRERLEALPYALRCIECKSDEDQRLIPVRSPEEPLLSPPFGRAAYGPYQIDRDDAWEIVAQHGTANSPQDTPDAFDDEDDHVDKGNG